MIAAEQLELQDYREQQLLRLMREISQDTFSAGWLKGLERILYRAAFCGSEEAVWITSLDSGRLASVATLANCWWHRPDYADEEQKISLAQAQVLYGGPND